MANSGPAVVAVGLPVRPTERAALAKVLLCLCLQPMAAWISSWSSTSSTRAGSERTGEMNSWGVPSPQSVPSQHSPIRWDLGDRAEREGKPQETWTLGAVRLVGDSSWEDNSVAACSSQ